VKVAVNVVRREGGEENVLPEVLYGWFGEDAGRPGTNYHVLFERSEDGYRARPQGSGARSEAGPETGRSYRRDEVPALLGMSGGGRAWQTGIVFQGQQMVLFVTLEKEGQPAEYAYRDRFLAPDRFQWQSQNRTPQGGTVGQAIRHHEERGIEVHLFVRRRAKADGRTLPFVYCGRLRFESWEGAKPITVRWQLERGLSEAVYRGLVG
jgi:hypothetical protein